MKAGEKPDFVAMRHLGKLLEKLFDAGLTVGRLAKTMQQLEQALGFRPFLWKDLVHQTLLRLPSHRSVREGLYPLPREARLTTEEETVLVDKVDDLAQAVSHAKRLFLAVHSGEAEEVRNCLTTLAEYTSAISEEMIFQDGLFSRQRTVRPELLATEHGEQAFYPLDALLAQLMSDYLMTGGGRYFRPCAYCGTLFFAQRDDARCCSGSCRAKLSVRNNA